MIRRRDNHIRMRRKRYIDRVHIARRPDHHGEIGEIVGKLMKQFLAIVYREIEPDIRIALSEFR